MKKIGLIGCGNIANGIVKAINDKVINFKIVDLFDIKREKAENLFKKIKDKSSLKISEDIDTFLSNKKINLVVECASQKAVKDYAKKIILSKKDFMIMSVGALVDENFFEKIRKLSERNKVKVYLPSGAILGIDGLKAVKFTKINEVILTTTKNPINLGKGKLREKVIVFNGNAKEAVKKFPKNINVAALISLTGVGFEKTKVRIVADPNVKENIHEIFVKGNFGEFNIKIKNLPSPENPKTSYLAILSAITTLKEIEEEEKGIKIGT